MVNKIDEKRKTAETDRPNEERLTEGTTSTYRQRSESFVRTYSLMIAETRFLFLYRSSHFCFVFLRSIGSSIGKTTLNVERKQDK